MPHRPPPSSSLSTRPRRRRRHRRATPPLRSSPHKSNTARSSAAAPSPSSPPPLILSSPAGDSPRATVSLLAAACVPSYAALRRAGRTAARACDSDPAVTTPTRCREGSSPWSRGRRGVRPSLAGPPLFAGAVATSRLAAAARRRCRDLKAGRAAATGGLPRPRPRSGPAPPPPTGRPQLPLLTGELEIIN